MGSASVSKILRLHGRLIINPTAGAPAYPHGGLEIGLWSDIEFDPNLRTHAIRGEEYGGHIVNRLVLGANPTIRATLRDYDADALGAVWPEVGSVSGDIRLLSRTLTTLGPGASLGSKTVSVLFVPRDSADQPHILLHNALPRVLEEETMSLSIGHEFAMRVAFEGWADASVSQKIVSIGKYSQLTF